MKWLKKILRRKRDWPFFSVNQQWKFADSRIERKCNSCFIRCTKCALSSNSYACFILENHQGDETFKKITAMEITNIVVCFFAVFTHQVTKQLDLHEIEWLCFFFIHHSFNNNIIAYITFLSKFQPFFKKSFWKKKKVDKIMKFIGFLKIN